MIHEVNGTASQAPSGMLDLSIIIVNWNSKAFLRQCLASVYAHPLDFAFEVIVVDNGSFDGCGEMLQAEFSRARFIQCPVNLGFAKSNNLGFLGSVGRNLLFLNPDTRVIGPAIQELLQQLEAQPCAGAVGGRILNTDQTLQTSCVQNYPTILGQILEFDALRQLAPFASFWGITALFNSAGQPQPVQAISGACLMVKRGVFEKVGCFSEDYFMYGEDIDLCYKINQAGLKSYHVPAASIVHYGGGSSRLQQNNFSSVMARESVYLLLKKTRGPWYGAGFRFFLGLSAVGRLALLLAAIPFRLLQGKYRQVLDSLGKWMAILRWTARGVGRENQILMETRRKMDPGMLPCRPFNQQKECLSWRK